MPFGAGLALVRRSAGVDEFRDEISGGASDAVTAVIGATTVESGGWVDDVYPEKWATEVIVEAGGQTYTRRGDHARGEPEKPLT